MNENISRTKSEDRLLSAEEVSHRLNINLKKALDLLKSKSIPAVEKDGAFWIRELYVKDHGIATLDNDGNLSKWWLFVAPRKNQATR